MPTDKNVVIYDRLQKTVAATEEQFLNIGKLRSEQDFGDPAAFAREAEHVMQILRAAPAKPGSTPYLVSCAMSHPDALHDAVIQIASIGLSLNPALQHAYLVPRDGRIRLDVGYRGLLKLAVDSGAIRSARADTVYANDAFSYESGSAPRIMHKPDVFGARGEFVGVYCVATLHDGSQFISPPIGAQRIYEIRDRSESYKRGGRGPWASDFDAMALKTIIKRDAKMWIAQAGLTAGTKLAEAVEMAHTADGYARLDPTTGEPITPEESGAAPPLPAPTDEPQPAPEEDEPAIEHLVSEDMIIGLRTALEQAGKDEAAMCAAYKLDRIEDMTVDLYESVVERLIRFTEARAADV